MRYELGLGIRIYAVLSQLIELNYGQAINSRDHPSGDC